MRINNYHKRVLEVSLDDAVTRIEVEKIIADDEDIVAKYYRTIRFTTDSGEVFEVSCDAFSEKRLEIVEVEHLGSVPPAKPDNGDWLRPKVFTGKSRHKPDRDHG